MDVFQLEISLLLQRRGVHILAVPLNGTARNGHGTVHAMAQGFLKMGRYWTIRQTGIFKNYLEIIQSVEYYFYEQNNRGIG